MATYGVTSTGFIKMRMPDVRAGMVDSITTAWGVDSISTSADTRLGVLLDVVSERLSALWECSEAVYNSMYPGTASGMQLDRAVSFTGVTRQSESYSTGSVILRADDGTVVPAGTQFRSTTDGDIYQLSAAATVSSKSACKAVVKVSSAGGGVKLSVTLNGREYSYTPVNTVSVEQAVKSLAGQLASAGSSYSVSASSDTITISTGLSANFSINVSGAIEITQLWSVGDITAIEAGAKNAVVGDVTNIITAVNGLTAVTNIAAITPGRAAENDADLRTRYPARLYRLGSGTENAISGYLQDKVSGISNVRVYSNRTAATVDGLAPHAVRVVVEGGSLDAIGKALLQCVAAGTTTVGSTTVKTLDSNGEEVSFYIDRPERVYIWVSVQVGALPTTEGQFPSDGLEKIAAAINAQESGVIGQDVVWGKVYASVFGVDGVDWISCGIYGNTDPTVEPAAGDYTQSRITINPNQIADFDLSRIKVFT